MSSCLQVGLSDPIIASESLFPQMSVFRIFWVLVSSSGAIFVYTLCVGLEVADPVFISNHCTLQDALTFYVLSTEKFMAGIHAASF